MLRCTWEPKMPQPEKNNRAQTHTLLVCLLSVSMAITGDSQTCLMAAHTWELTKNTNCQRSGFWFHRLGGKPRIKTFNKHWINVRQVKGTHATYSYFILLLFFNVSFSNFPSCWEVGKLFSVKGKRAAISDFVGHSVFVANTSLCCCRWKAAIDSMLPNGVAVFW